MTQVSWKQQACYASRLQVSCTNKDQPQSHILLPLILLLPPFWILCSTILLSSTVSHSCHFSLCCLVGVVTGQGWPPGAYALLFFTLCIFSYCSLPHVATGLLHSFTNISFSQMVWDVPPHLTAQNLHASPVLCLL